MSDYFAVVDDRGFVTSTGYGVPPEGALLLDAPLVLPPMETGYRYHLASGAPMDARTDEQKYADADNAARDSRARLLQQSDWTQLSDVPLDTKDAWAAYRQALRDVPEQAGYPFNIVWPTPPQ